MSRSPRRVTVLFVALFSGIVITGGIAASILVDPTEKVELLFGRGDGFGTQSAHGTGSEDADFLLNAVTTFKDDTLQSLVVDATVGDDDVGLLHAYVDPSDPEGTTVEFGGESVTVDDLLEQVPLTEIQSTLEELRAWGWDEAGNITNGGEDPGEPPEPGPSEVFEAEGVLVILLHPDASAVEMIVYPQEGFGGMRVVVSPWIVEKQDAEGRLIDVRVRNPFAAVAVEGGDFKIQDLKCKAGGCISNQYWQRLCNTPGAACEGKSLLIQPGEALGGSPVQLPDTLLHLWSADHLVGGAGLQLLDQEPEFFAAPYWEGNPFGAQGLTLTDTRGIAAQVKIHIPTTAEPYFSIEIEGPIVPTLGAEKDLSTLTLQMDVGPVSLDTADVFAGFDALNALLVETWTATDGRVASVAFLPLLQPEPLLEIVSSEEGESHILIDSVQAEIVAQGTEIQAAADDLTGGYLQPGKTLLATLVEFGSGKKSVAVSAVKQAAGCEDTLRGCVAFTIESAKQTADGHVEELEGTIGGLPLPLDTSEVDVYVNMLTGLVLGSIPAADDCFDPVTGLPTGAPGCIGIPSPDNEVVAAAVGLVTGTADGLLFTPDPEEPTSILVYNPVDDTVLLQLDNAHLEIAGASARWADGEHLIDLLGPAGHICVDSTFGPAQLEQGAFPSATVGCDGIGGATLVLQPGAAYELDGTRLMRFTVADPTSPGSYLFYYYDNGDTTTIASGIEELGGSYTIDSTLVHVSGNPVTSAAWSIGLAGDHNSAGGLFQQVDVTKQVYADGRAKLSELPPGSELAVAFYLIEGPDSKIVLGPGDPRVTDLSGSAWLSGIRDTPYTVRVDDAFAGDRLDIVYSVGGNPRHGIDPSFPMPLAGVDDKKGINRYEGVLKGDAASALPDGAELRFLLAWTDGFGPVAISRLDDNGGAMYRYKLDTKAPAATISAPKTSDAAVFKVIWDSQDRSGSGLDRFYVEVSEGASAGAGGWTQWIAGTAAEDPRSAFYSGAPGKHHWFRAQACDNVGNCGPWSSATDTQIAGAAAPDEPVPSVTVTAPQAGARLLGLIAMRWDVAYEGDATPITTIEARRADTTRWISVYSGQGHETTWDTAGLYDGAYDLRFIVSDGEHSSETIVAVALANGNLEETLDPIKERLGEIPLVGGAPPEEVDGAKKGDKKGSPGATPLLLVGALAGLLFVARRTGRRG